MKELISTGANRSIALVGISKNSGKTTLLNSILHDYPEHDWGVFSTGSDGEEKDRLFKTPKPRVELPAGTFFCCDALTLDAHGSSVELLASSSYSGRKLFIARAIHSVDTQITGPSTTKQQTKIVQKLFSLGAEKVIIDGSLDRKSIALEDEVDALVLCIGASFGDPQQIINEIRRLLLLRDIPKIDSGNYLRTRFTSAQGILTQRQGKWYESGIQSLINHEKKIMEDLNSETTALFVPTSFTDSLYDKLGKAIAQSGIDLIFRHPECIKLSLAKLQKLMDHTRISTLIPFKLKAYALNSTAIASDPIAADIFRQEIRAAFPQISFIDIMEVRYAG